MSLVLWIGALIEDSTNRMLGGNYGKGITKSDESMLGESHLHSPLVCRHFGLFAPAFTMILLPATSPAFSFQPRLSCMGCITSLYFMSICLSDCSWSEKHSAMKLACSHSIGTSFRVACARPFRLVCTCLNTTAYVVAMELSTPIHFTYLACWSWTSTRPDMLSLLKLIFSCTPPVYDDAMLARPYLTPTRV